MNRPSIRGTPASRVVDPSSEETPSSNLQTTNGRPVMEDWKLGNGDSNANYGSTKADVPNNFSVNAITSNGYSEYTAKSTCSGQGRMKRGFAFSLGTSMLLSFVSIFTFVGMIGTRSPGYNLHLVPSIGSIHRPHRRMQAEFLNIDPLRVGIFDQGPVRVKELPPCDSMEEDLVPGYIDAASHVLLHGQGNYLERHGVEASSVKKRAVEQCLIPPPENYRVPPRWPSSKDHIWNGNMKFTQQSALSGARMTRLKLGGDDVVSLDMDQIHMDGLDQHAQLMSKLLPYLSADQANTVPMVLDINCGLNRIHNHIDNAIALCLAPYEANGSQVQFSLERGFPAMIGSLLNSKLPFPTFSFDMIHCFDCNLNLSRNGGASLFELDRLLKPGGIFVHAPIGEGLAIKGHFKQHLTNNLCWSPLSEDEKTSVWRKASNHSCYASSRAKPILCGKPLEPESTWYPPLHPCVTTTQSTSNNPTDNQAKDRGSLNEFSREEASDRFDDSLVWSGTVKSYWSLLSPLLFSDHPKRPGEEDPLPPSNIVRNVMDMNALHGSLNIALLKAKKSVWVMNVVPRNGPDTLSSIYERGLIGVKHDWCEPFPTYPRTYDLLHGIGILSRQEASTSRGCGLSSLLLEMDRILRPDGWVILRDRVDLIEDARIAVSQMRWETRVISGEGLEDQELLVCQKTFWKVQRANVS